jgi:hypothetical protein
METTVEMMRAMTTSVMQVVTSLTDSPRFIKRPRGAIVTMGHGEREGLLRAQAAGQPPGLLEQIVEPDCPREIEHHQHPERQCMEKRCSLIVSQVCDA